MPKQNLLAKKIKKQFLSINDSLENYFSKINNFKEIFRKYKQNRVILAFGVLVILTLSYFLVPTMYNKNKIQAEIKNQILKKYQIDLKFNEKIRYALLPRPHFTTKNLSIIREKNEIGKAQNFKIFIGIKNFLRFDQTIIEDLVFVKTDFNFNKEDLFFFEDLLKTEPNENKIIFKKSNFIE